MDFNLTILIITLNVNALIVSVKRQTLCLLLNWIRKQESTTCCLQETHFKYKGTYDSKKIGKIYHANTNQKEALVAVLISV